MTRTYKFLKKLSINLLNVFKTKEDVQKKLTKIAQLAINKKLIKSWFL